MRRISRWKTPPHWSISAWMEEMRSEASAAAYEAVCAFDPGRGIPLECFVRKRVLGRALDRYRKEWAYGHRWAYGSDGCLGGTEETDFTAPDLMALQAALTQLADEDRMLLRQLYWDRSTEAGTAKVLGISQQAVNRRKLAILHRLRRLLGVQSEKREDRGC